jgi:hypothetical protein
MLLQVHLRVGHTALFNDVVDAHLGYLLQAILARQLQPGVGRAVAFCQPRGQQWCGTRVGATVHDVPPHPACSMGQQQEHKTSDASTKDCMQSIPHPTPQKELWVLAAPA